MLKWSPKYAHEILSLGELVADVTHIRRGNRKHVIIRILIYERVLAVAEIPWIVIIHKIVVAGLAMGLDAWLQRGGIAVTARRRAGWSRRS